MDQKEALDKLLEVIDRIAEGDYGEEIMSLTREDVPEPVRTVAEAMGLMMVRVEAREFHLENLVDELRQLNEQIKTNTLATVSAMAEALATRDAYTQGHTARVARLARELAGRMGMDDEEAELVRLAGELHDIGKIGFSDTLFDDHGQKIEGDLLKQITKHPALGARILAHLDFLGPVSEYVYCHHERIDGKGYPRRLQGEQIPLGAQVLSVADAYDAMTTDRPYQKALTHQEAISILRKFVGQRYLPEVVDAFEKMMAEKD
jgi:putative nucleotidyltransferase with HDIG domain